MIKKLIIIFIFSFILGNLIVLPVEAGCCVNYSTGNCRSEIRYLWECNAWGGETYDEGTRCDAQGRCTDAPEIPWYMIENNICKDSQGKPIEVSWLKTIIPPDGLIIPCGCLDSYPSSSGGVCSGLEGKCTDCGLNEIFQTIINISKLILALTGSIALLMFIYGGVMFIISTGNTERIQKAKQILAAAAVGIIIILSAWVIINFVIWTLTGGIISEVKLFGQPWAQQQIQGSTPTTSISPK